MTSAKWRLFCLGFNELKEDVVQTWLHGITGERQDGAAAVATLLPPDLNGATAGKHARIDGSAWHTASFYPSWEVNIYRPNDTSLPVVYKISYRTISRMSKMCVYRQIFVI